MPMEREGETLYKGVTRFGERQGYFQPGIKPSPRQGSSSDVFIVIFALMSQTQQGHHKEESVYSKNGQCSRSSMQPESTLNQRGTVSGIRLPSKP